MPGPLVHAGATVQCAHGGMAQPTQPDPRVKVMGMPVVTIAAPYTIAGCTFPPPPAGNGPCVTAQWLAGTTRVFASGVPLVVQSSQAVATPTGAPLIVVATQTRVTAM